MNFDSYIVSNTKTSLSMPLACLPPQKPKHSKGFKRFAFTLAETLITLTIIGVIAALTVPNLLNKYTKHTYVIGLKKAYSQLQNAIKMIPITEGCSGDDYDCAGMFTGERIINGETVTFPTYDIDDMNFNNIPAFKSTYLLSKNLKSNKLCLGTPNECFSGNYDVSSFVENMDTETAGYMVLADGSYIALKKYSFISVDINGPKGPNLWGRDWFLFDIAESQGGAKAKGVHPGQLLPVGSFQYSMHGFGNATQYWKNNNNCSSINVKNKSDLATHCTGKVLEEDAMNY